MKSTLLAICAALLLPLGGMAQNVHADYWDGRIFVQFRPDCDPVGNRDVVRSRASDDSKDWYTALAAKYGITEEKDYFKNLRHEAFDHVYELYFSKQADVAQFIKDLEARPCVLYAEKVPLYRSTHTPNDPRFSQQWTMQVIQAVQAWDIHRGTRREVVIAIVDDAVKISHEDLEPNLWVNTGEIPGNGIDDDGNGYIDDVHGYDVANNKADPNPPASAGNFNFSHGTHCAGIAMARSENSRGISSLGFDCKLMAVKAKLSESQSIGIERTMEGIVYAVANRPDVISMSFGGSGNGNTTQNLFNYAYELGIICIAAAGNDNVNLEFFPAASKNVISVASTDSQDKKSGFSNFGEWIDISAPGSDILSTVAGSNSSYTFYSGTSMACPNVAGLAGYLFGYHPNVTAADVEKCLLNTTDNLDATDPQYAGMMGNGRINALKGIRCLADHPAEARPAFPRVHYTNSPVRFEDRSLNGTFSRWSIGDQFTSEEEQFSYTFDQTGDFPVSLRITEQASKETSIRILPRLPLPYTPGTPGYDGDFESQSGHFGVYNQSGSEWIAGNSSVSGKNGANSGQSAYVLAPDDQYYEPGTRSYLYTPMFDFSDPGLYELSFYAKYEISSGLDGFHVEYSEDGGTTWKKLGTQQPGWYTTTNTSLGISAYLLGESYFTGRQPTFRKFQYNVSQFSGQEGVAFRFVFKSQDRGFFTGLALDDFQIRSYEGNLGTELQSFEGGFDRNRRIQLNWTTLPEYYCRGFRVEVSTNGFTFDSVAYVQGQLFDIEPTGYLYTTPSERLRDIYFYRLFVENYDTQTGYDSSFYSPVIVVRKNLSGTEVYTASPNPFDDHVGVTFTDKLSVPLRFRLFDTQGKELRSGELAEGQVYYRIGLDGILPGAYVLYLEFGSDSKDRKAVKVVKAQ